MLPNLSALGQTPTGHKQQVFVWLTNRVKKAQEPNRDPITALDWRQAVRDKEDDDEKVPPHGWILRVIDPKTGQVVVEDDYLYNIEELAQHLINGGRSPISQREPEEADRQDCIDAANALREKKEPPQPPLQPQFNADPEPPEPLMVRRREPYLHEVDPDAIAEHHRRADAEREARLEQIPLVGRLRGRGPRAEAARNRRRDTRQRWRGTDYPALPDDVRARLEGWLRVLPEDDAQSFIVYAGEALQIPNIVNDEMLTWTMGRLLMRLDWLIREANAGWAAGGWAAAVRIPGWVDSMESFTDFVGRGHGIHREGNQDAMTAWVDNLWQMVGVWTRRRAEQQGNIPQARAMQQLPSFPP